MKFESDARIVINSLKKFRNDSSKRKKKVTSIEPMDKIIKNLKLESYIKEGGLTGSVLEEFIDIYLSYSTRIHHPTYFGHQCAATHYSGALASLVDGFTNNVNSVYEMGPASVSIEFFTINWMLEKVGWRPSPTNLDTEYDHNEFSGGVFINGGSLANLTALLVARSKVVPDVWQKGIPSDLAVLVSEESHYSVIKSAGIIGIGKNLTYKLDTDVTGAIIPDKISTVIDKLYNDGKRPLALVANACSTPVGIYDPLEEIAEICKSNQIWFHIDGAHGASALLSDKYRGFLKGIEKADSLIWDAHKLLQTPSLCAALLVKNGDYLDRAMDHNASYLFHEKEQQGIDFIQRSIECTRSGLGMKFFFVLASIGESGLQKVVDQLYDLTLESYYYLKNQRDFECPVIPQSNILCFRIDGSDDKQLKIRNKLTNEGSFYLTSTEFKGKRFLRLVLMSPNTKIQDIHKLIDRIREIYTEII
ncbi:MAG: pyridoxal-dependent decarboxylase [Ignavibacteria bacterium]|jgi:L-2,4-diaminobutyrate decarboxylase